MNKILVVGSLNMDLVTKVKVTPKVGETILGSGLIQVLGGKGGNQAVAIARLGGRVAMLGKVAYDSFGRRLVEGLEQDGVNVDNISKTSKYPTGTALIMVNDDGDNSIVVVSGANFDLLESDISEEIIEEYDIIVAQLETPIETVKKVFQMAKAKGKYTVLNPAPARSLDDELLSNTDLLIPNETEFELLTGVNARSTENILKGTKVLLSKDVKSVIVTLGKRGSMYIDKYTSKLFNSYNVDVVDTTAAGDSFVAGIVVKLSEGSSVINAIEFATKVASITIGKIGAQSSLPYLKDLEDFTCH